MKKKWVVFIGLALIAGVWLMYYLFSMKFEDTNDVKADFEINSLDLIKEFQLNDSIANAKYTEKILTVNGVVSESEKADSSINIKMTDDESGSYIIFSFQKSEDNKLMSVNAGDMLSIKGSCSGAIYSEILNAYSVSLKRCILLNPKK